MWKRTKIQKQGHNLVQHSTEWDTERQCTLDQEERCPRLGQIEISMHKWEIKKKGVSPQSPINDKRQNYWKTNKDINRSRLIYHHCWFDINPNQDGHCRGCSRVGCQNTPPLPKICDTSYNDETWHSYTLPREDPKNIWITWHTLWVVLTSAFFHRKSVNFVISRNTNIDCILMHNF